LLFEIAQTNYIILVSIPKWYRIVACINLYIIPESELLKTSEQKTRSWKKSVCVGNSIAIRRLELELVAAQLPAGTDIFSISDLVSPSIPISHIEEFLSFTFIYSYSQSQLAWHVLVVLNDHVYGCRCPFQNFK
jgi:hypothetical protein